MIVGFTPFPTLETQRLSLRKLEPKDDKQTFDYRSNRKHFPYVDMPLYTDIGQARAYREKINVGIENDQWILWAIANKKDDTILGTATLWNLDDKAHTAEVGYGLYPGNLGQGYMTEALKAVTDFGIKVMQLSTIDAYTHVDNQPSRALLVRCGYKELRPFTETETTDGKPIPLVIYRYTSS